MAKTKKAEKATPTVEAVMEQPVVKTNSWVIKDRVYALKDGLAPLTYTVRSSNIYYFDEEKGYERELKYTNNQTTPFVDEFKGDAKLEHITFQDGLLKVPKKNKLYKNYYHYITHKEIVYSLSLIQKQKQKIN